MIVTYSIIILTRSSIFRRTILIGTSRRNIVLAFNVVTILNIVSTTSNISITIGNSIGTVNCLYGLNITILTSNERLHQINFQTTRISIIDRLGMLTNSLIIYITIIYRYDRINYDTSSMEIYLYANTIGAP